MGYVLFSGIGSLFFEEFVYVRSIIWIEGCLLFRYLFDYIMYGY